MSYRNYELVVRLFSKHFSANLVWLHFTLVPGVHCGNYVLIRNSAYLDFLVKFVLIWYVITVITILIAMLTISGFVHNNCKANSQSWLQNIHLKRKDRTLLKLFRKSCKPIVIGNNMVKVGTSSAGKFITLVSRDTFRTLITLRVVQYGKHYYS